MSDLLTAAALVLVFEGLIYAAFPGPARRLLARLLEWSTDHLRAGGVVTAAFGILCLWLIRG